MTVPIFFHGRRTHFRDGGSHSSRRDRPARRTVGWMKPFGCKENAAVKESATRVPGLRLESLRNPVS
jgi:hypothetical protein